jgi:Domain of unknown function (DUF4864)/zinc-ribbon domain
MYCKHCGKQIEPADTFCSQCGLKNLNEGDSPSPSSRFHQRIPRWFKWLSGLFLCFILFHVFLILISPDLTDTVSEQFTALRENRITEAYYNYTTKEFQTAVSLENFREFTQKYPFLIHQKSVKFIERNVEGDNGLLKAVINTDNSEPILMNFRLSKEDDKWKILGMTLELQDQSQISEIERKSTPAAAFDDRPIYNRIQEQLEKIRQGNLSEAYYQYTGKEFQKATSYKEFEKFILKHLEFSNSLKIEIGHLTFDNNIAEVNGILKSKDGNSYKIEYNLVFEENEWKIIYIHFIPSGTKESTQENRGPISFQTERVK